MIKLIASDMDGTLLNKEGELSKEFFEVFEMLQSKDIKFVAASGRQYFQLLKNFEGIEDKIHYVAENGTIVKYEDRELYIDALSKDLVDEIIEFLPELKDIYVVICGKKSAYVNTTDRKILDEFDNYYFKYKVVENFNNIDDDILKIAFLDLNGVEKNIYKPLNDRFGDKLQVTISGPIWLDMFNLGTSKGTAIKLLQDLYGIKAEETMVFGDYYNDIEMLKAAHYSYAMENAPDGVKMHARYIAKSNIENGVIRAIREVVLNEKSKVG